MNGLQMQHAIDSATHRVLAQGTENASSTDLMLAGFGWLGAVIKESRPRPLEGKKLLPIGVALGGIVVGVVQGLAL